jgi:hypothetical protein
LTRSRSFEARHDRSGHPRRRATAQTAGGDLLSKFDPLIAERQALLDTGVRDPFAIVMDEVHSPVLATIGGARRSCSARTIIWA